MKFAGESTVTGGKEHITGPIGAGDTCQIVMAALFHFVSVLGSYPKNVSIGY